MITQPHQGQLEKTAWGKALLGCPGQRGAGLSVRTHICICPLCLTAVSAHSCHLGGCARVHAHTHTYSHTHTHTHTLALGPAEGWAKGRVLPQRPWGSDCRLPVLRLGSLRFLLPLRLPNRFMGSWGRRGSWARCACQDLQGTVSAPGGHGPGGVLHGLAGVEPESSETPPARARPQPGVPSQRWRGCPRGQQPLDRPGGPHLCTLPPGPRQSWSSRCP